MSDFETLYLIRGLPGSGKSTLGEALCPKRAFSADDYFELMALSTGKSYSDVFNPEHLEAAHESCFNKVFTAMSDSDNSIAVCNTFSEPWEAERYINLAKKQGWYLSIVECQNTFGSTHNVPETTINAMERRWKKLR